MVSGVHPHQCSDVLVVTVRQEGGREGAEDGVMPEASRGGPAEAGEEVHGQKVSLQVVPNTPLYLAALHCSSPPVWGK